MTYDPVEALRGSRERARGGGRRAAELHVRSYKNLQSVRVSVSGRIVLYGRNGAGKTNLLETLALVAGNRVTVEQVARQATKPSPGDIEVVLGGPDAHSNNLATKTTKPHDCSGRR